MQQIGTMLRKSGHHVIRQRELFALRARKAGTTFAVETRDASLELASAVRAEAAAWRKYVLEGTRSISIAPVSIEKTIWTRIDGALRALESRVQRRIHALSGNGAAKRTRSPKAKRVRRPAH